MFLGWASDFVVIKYNNAIFAKIQQNQGFQGVVIKTGGISGYQFRRVIIMNMDWILKCCPDYETLVEFDNIEIKEGIQEIHGLKEQTNTDRKSVV